MFSAVTFSTSMILSQPSVSAGISKRVRISLMTEVHFSLLTPRASPRQRRSASSPSV